MCIRDRLDSGLVDAVVIAVPHYLHPEMAIAALERDLHVIQLRQGVSMGPGHSP